MSEDDPRLLLVKQLAQIRAGCTVKVPRLSQEVLDKYNIGRNTVRKTSKLHLIGPSFYELDTESDDDDDDDIQSEIVRKRNNPIRTIFLTDSKEDDDDNELESHSTAVKSLSSSSKTTISSSVEAVLEKPLPAATDELGETPSETNSISGGDHPTSENEAIPSHPEACETSSKTDSTSSADSPALSAANTSNSASSCENSIEPHSNANSCKNSIEPYSKDDGTSNEPSAAISLLNSNTRSSVITRAVNSENSSKGDETSNEKSAPLAVPNPGPSTNKVPSATVPAPASSPQIAKSPKIRVISSEKLGLNNENCFNQLVVVDSSINRAVETVAVNLAQKLDENMDKIMQQMEIDMSKFIHRKNISTQCEEIVESRSRKRAVSNVAPSPQMCKSSVMLPFQSTHKVPVKITRTNAPPVRTLANQSNSHVAFSQGNVPSNPSNYSTSFSQNSPRYLQHLMGPEITQNMMRSANIKSRLAETAVHPVVSTTTILRPSIPARLPIPLHHTISTRQSPPIHLNVSARISLSNSPPYSVRSSIPAHQSYPGYPSNSIHPASIPSYNPAMTPQTYPNRYSNATSPDMNPILPNQLLYSPSQFSRAVSPGMSATMQCNQAYNQYCNPGNIYETSRNNLTNVNKPVLWSSLNPYAEQRIMQRWQHPSPRIHTTSYNAPNVRNESNKNSIFSTSQSSFSTHQIPSSSLSLFCGDKPLSVPEVNSTLSPSAGPSPNLVPCYEMPISVPIVQSSSSPSVEEICNFTGLNFSGPFLKDSEFRELMKSNDLNIHMEGMDHGNITQSERNE